MRTHSWISSTVTLKVLVSNDMINCKILDESMHPRFDLIPKQAKHTPSSAQLACLRTHLDSYSHIVLDEVHERFVEADFLMALRPGGEGCVKHRRPPCWARPRSR